MSRQWTRQRVADDLLALNNRFDELLKLIRDFPLDPPKRLEARKVLRELKDALAKASRESKGYKTPHICEFHSATSQASSSIMVRTNTTPGERWIQDLTYAQVSISHSYYRCRKPAQV